MRRRLVFGGIAALVSFAFWLHADLELLAIGGSPHDDEWFLRTALVGYWFGDEPYSQMSFIKEPVFPLFAALCYCLGMPLRLGTQVLYIAAAGFLGWSLVRRQSRAEVGLVIFAVCVVQPVSFLVLSRVLSDSIYISLFMITLGALVMHFKMSTEPGRWRRGLLSGVALGLLWSTRPERQLLVLIVLFFLTASAFVEWRRKITWASALRTWLTQWSLPLVTCLVMTAAVMTANWVRWGVFSITAQDSPGFNAAYQALVRIEQKRPIHRVSVNREARQLAYAVSPRFREVEPFLENKEAWWYASTREVFPQTPPGEVVTGWFQWGLRDAAALAGHHESGPQSERFYYQIAAELNQAAAEGSLSTRTVFPFLLDPNVDSYSNEIVPSWNKLWSTCFAQAVPQPSSGRLETPGTTPEAAAFFDRVTSRREIPPTPQFQMRVREWLAKSFAGYTQTAMVVSLLCATAVLIMRRKAPGTAMYLFTAAVFGFAGVTRLAAFALVEASAFGAAADMRYLCPAALALTVATVWLIGDGVRLLISPNPDATAAAAHSVDLVFERLPAGAPRACARAANGRAPGGLVRMSVTYGPCRAY